VKYAWYVTTNLDANNNTHFCYIKSLDENFGNTNSKLGIIVNSLYYVISQSEWLVGIPLVELDKGVAACMLLMTRMMLQCGSNVLPWTFILFNEFCLKFVNILLTL